MNLQNVQLKKLYEFRVPLHRQLSLDGQNQVYEYLAMVRIHAPKMFDVVLADENAAFEVDGVKYRGGILARIQKYLYENKGVDLAERHKTFLGNIIAAGMIGGDDPFYMDFVDYIRWRPGTFNENPESCWWHSYAPGKRIFVNEIKNGNGLAIRLFKPRTKESWADKTFYGHFVGAGRCFAWLDESGMDVLFNGYGLQISEFGMIFRQVMDYKHGQRIRLYTEAQRSIFINGSAGFALSHEPIKVDTLEIDGIGFYRKRTCPECGKKERFPDSIGVCKSCMNRLFLRTQSGRWVRKDDPRLVQIQYVAIQYHYATDKYVPQVATYTELIDDLNRYRHCEKCDHYYANYVKICPNCGESYGRS